ncbi:MAG: ATP-binding protein [Anaerolineales bacterium]|nr:ATP-binding protein [Anaerolineales bacterium]MDW8278998.1 ATP-binding protein [Anaerolineales bacterium]
MDIFFWLPDSYPVLLFPSAIGIAGWLLLAVLLAWKLWSWWHTQPAWQERNLLAVMVLLVLQAIFALSIGLRLPAETALPVPNSPQELKNPALMLFSALPWMVAGGLFGPFPAALAGFLGGAVRLLWDSHSLFTPLELALLAGLFSTAVRQRYRTRLFRLLSEPLIAAAALALVYVPLHIATAFFTIADPANLSIADSLIYAVSSTSNAAPAIGAEFLIGGLFTQILAIAFPAWFGRRLPLQPSPTERSLEARFLFGTGALTVLLLLALLVGNWVVAGNSAREMLSKRMKGTAELTAQSVPFFLETGQNLALQMAHTPNIATAQGQALSSLLSEEIRSVPFFDQLLVFDRQKQVVGSYPAATAPSLLLYPEELNGIDLALNGVLSQTYPIPPAQTGRPARISFIAVIPASSEAAEAGRVLIARTDLSNNPFFQPILTNLRAMQELGGEGILLDENGRILYHSAEQQVMTSYTGRIETQAGFFDDTGRGGTRNLVYYQPVAGRAWSVVLTVPAQQAQQLALDIAAPLSGMIVALALIALVSLRLGLKAVTTSLQSLSSEAVRIAQGQLDHAMTVEGVDEVGQLRRAFEQMRISLQSRLEELNRLLLVSQGVASSLDLQDAIQPVMEAVLAIGANSVRVVMTPQEDEAEAEKGGVFALGPSKEKYAYLDEQIAHLVQQQERLVLTNVFRARGLELSTGRPMPASLLAMSLRHENRYYGVLWAGFDQPRLFSETDVRFMTTLAGQAALAASNNHLFRTAEVGRQRLAAILASTPDPVLVTDQYNRLLLSNPAAWQAFGPAVGTGEGQPIEKLITQQTLIDILSVNAPPDKLSAEVTLLNNQVYLATASPVVADGRPMGRVCILRDITHFKQLDTLKTEFVSTVSHDLRSPLTLMRGYATMLEMVGSLNEQQQGYVKKIVIGVENMSRMVNNLLDLGRIEAGVGLNLQMVPVTDTVERVVSTLQPQAAQKNITLTSQMPENTMPLVEADSALLEQAMYNLVENAIKYTPKDGRVSVRLKIIGDAIQFEVEDTGIGIAPIDQPRLFEKFYRGGQREAREQKGSGLGLAIVKSIAERHGGKVWLESQLGKGSTFFLQVPLRQPERKTEKR